MPNFPPLMPPPKTIREKIFRELSTLVLADDFLTSTELSRLTKVKLSSISSVLRKMVRKKEIIRKEDFGPRKGFGYRLKTVEESIFDSMIDKLQQDIDKQLFDDMMKYFGTGDLI